jgi:subtilisin family serine protease
MASPNVAGVATLIRSYYPKLSAKQVKHILMDSGTAITTDVVVGGDPKDKRPFSALSTSGKIVNAYNALKMADEMSKKIKSKKIKG